MAGTAEYPEGTPHYTKELFDHLKRPPMIQPNTLSEGISAKDYKDGWTVMNERTSSASLCDSSVLILFAFSSLKPQSEQKCFSDLQQLRTFH